MNETEQRRAARTRFQAHYRALYDEVLEILFALDPIGVRGQDNREKFVPEAASILPRLQDARSAEDVELIIQEELRRWYGRRRLAREAPRSRHDRDLHRVESFPRRHLSIVIRPSRPCTEFSSHQAHFRMARTTRE